MFRFVNFMARRTSHLRVLVAPASLRERNLIAVHVHARVGVGTRQFDVIPELLSRNVRKRWRNRLPNPAMALRAHFNLSIPRQSRRIHNRMSPRRNGGRFRSFLLRVLTAGPVASLARNAQNEARFFIVVIAFLGRDWLKISGVTLQAVRRNWPVEVRNSFRVSGTVDPSFH